jgi:Asp/Glu/hydantoin racemase
LLEEFVAAIGLSSQLASVRTMAPTGDQVAANPEAALDSLAASCRDCAEADGAEVIILGGLGLAGLAERIADAVPVPLLDSVSAAVRVAETAASLGARKAASGFFAASAPIKTTALSARLAALIEGRVAR